MSAAAPQQQQQPPPQQQPQPSSAPPVLPWMRVPISISAGTGVPLADVQGLHPRLLAAVRQTLGFAELFPVQSAVWRGLAGGASSAHDMCLCAPTGSGKTLAYALPLLNAILTNCQPATCHVLRALVVLPTRDLAAQVFSVLHSLGSAAGVSVVLTAAQESVAAEAEKLAAHPSRPSSSGPHVLVATPGRLLAHLQASGSSSSITGVSLAHLRFLVVDEADRLLRQDYQGWLPQVLANIRSSSPHGGGGGIMQEGVPWQQQAFSSRSLPWLEQPVSTSSSTSSRVLKLVVSATLTRDPSKLQRLELACPRYIALTGVDRRYALPPALRQHRIVVPAQHKPLALVALLSQLTTAGGAAADGAPCGRCLVFASSLDTTHRLQLLLAAVPALAPRVAEYSSHVSASQRAASLAAFKAGRLAVLVTSDAMSRGMDVSSVGAVVNYDPPTFPKTYVHRAGRTARAGSEGAVYSLCKPEDVVHFNGMLRKLAGSRCTQFRLPPDLLQAHRPALRAALQQVQALVALEQEAQQQQPGAVIPAKAAAAARDGGGRKRQHDDGGEGEERQQQQQQKEVAGKRQRKQQKQQQQG